MAGETHIDMEVQQVNLGRNAAGQKVANVVATMVGGETGGEILAQFAFLTPVADAPGVGDEYELVVRRKTVGKIAIARPG